jgi:hypothetical protein
MIPYSFVVSDIFLTAVTYELHQRCFTLQCAEFFSWQNCKLFHIAIASDISDNMESNLCRRSINKKGQNMVLKIRALHVLQMYSIVSLNDIMSL